MSIEGVRLDEAVIDSRLVATLRTDDMERYRAVPATVMINQWHDDLEWLIVDSTYPAQIRRRYALLTNHCDMVIDRLPGEEVQASEKELLEAVTGYLLQTYPNYFRRDGNLVSSGLTGMTIDIGPEGADPLTALSLLASEDFLLLLPDVCETDQPVAYRLKAGALLFPNGWSLRSRFDTPLPAVGDLDAQAQWEAARQRSLGAARLGKTPYEIHNGHVTHYMEHFAARVDRFFSQMRPGMSAWRRNWSLKMSAELFLHSDTSPVRLPPSSAANWADHGYLRSEQQAFIKLPVCGAVVFSIKTYVWKLSELVKCPPALEALIVASDHLPPGMVSYRAADLPAFREFLDRFRFVANQEQ